MMQPDGPVEDLFQRLHDTRFNLLVFGQTVPSATLVEQFGDDLRVHAVPASSTNDAALSHERIPSVSFYLLRPDGHVGLCGSKVSMSVIWTYLAEHAHLKNKAERPQGSHSNEAPSFGTRQPTHLETIS
jgi:hypothetical protein